MDPVSTEIDLAVIYEVLNAISTFITNDASDDTTELIEYVDSLNNGTIGDNDLEKIFMYDDDNTVFTEISSRLEVIDARLDHTNKLLQDGFSFIYTAVIIFASFKFFAWFSRLVGV